jgi:hypothetical protein
MAFGITGFFSVFYWLRHTEKTLARPFVFKNLVASLKMSEDGQKVVISFNGSEAREMCIIHSYLLRGPGEKVKNRAGIPRAFRSAEPYNHRPSSIF